MKDKYFWLKANGKNLEIDADEYQKLITEKKHRLARTFGSNILLSKNDNFISVKSDQLYSILSDMGY